MADKRAFANPQRLDQPFHFTSAGKIYSPQRYLVGWPDGIVKVGSTDNGRKRWGPFLRRGAEMLDLANYGKDGSEMHAELWLQAQLRSRFSRAFASKPEAAPYLGSRGAGYLECYSIPVSRWPEIVDLARS